jgi:hypothetical protein
LLLLLLLLILLLLVLACLAHEIFYTSSVDLNSNEGLVPAEANPF